MKVSELDEMLLGKCGEVPVRSTSQLDSFIFESKETNSMIA